MGSALLAISLNKIIKAYNSSITALEHFKDTLLSGNDVVSFTCLDQHRKNVLSNNKTLTQIWLLLLVVGFILQRCLCKYYSSARTPGGSHPLSLSRRAKKNTTFGVLFFCGERGITCMIPK